MIGGKLRIGEPCLSMQYEKRPVYTKKPDKDSSGNGFKEVFDIEMQKLDATKCGPTESV